MSISTINDGDVPSVNSTDGTQNEELLKQYREQYQQFLSQYEDASAAWSNTASDVKTNVGEAVIIAVNNKLNEAQEKLNAFQAIVNTSETSEETLKTMVEELKTSVSNVTAYIAAVSTMAADIADVAALKKTFGALSDADKILLGSEFTQAPDAKFDAFNKKIAELKTDIAEGKDPSVIQELQTKITELKAALDNLINGTTDGSIMSLTNRLACLKSLEENRAYLSETQYKMLQEQLVSTDLSKQISKEAFETQLEAIILSAVRQKTSEDIKAAEETQKSNTAYNEILKNNLTLKVMQAKSSLRDIELEAQMDEKQQKEADFNPQVKRLRDEGRWQVEENMRQQEITSEHIREEQHREVANQVR